MTEEKTAPEVSLSEALREAIQQVFNKYPMSGDPSGYLGDYILISEVHTGAQTVLRIVDTDMSPWKRTGLLQWEINDNIAESAAGYAWSMSVGDDDGDGETL